MSEAIFSASSLLVLPFWFLMLFLPSWRGTERVMRSPLVAAGAALLYLGLVLPLLAEVFPVVLRPTLPAVAALLGSEAGATLAWAHFLAFDLLVGRGIYRDARRRGLSPLVVSPLLFLTLMLGPVGYLLYLIVRPVPQGAGRRLRTALAAAWRADRPLTLVGLLTAALLVACAAGIVLDPRVITGAPAWLKPAKFAVSITIYAFTLVWLLRFVTGRPRLVRLISGVTALCLGIEMVVIVAQVVRGTASHFNVSTPLDAVLWTVMSLSILPVWLLCALLAALLMRQRNLDPALGAAVRWGAVIAAVGMALAFFMTRPTPEQRARFGREPVRTVGAHSVGVPDGGPGLPVVGWSTQGGDLRVAHFVGLHGLQALPLLAWALAPLRRRRELTVQQAAGLVHAGGAAYLGVTLLAAWQALRGQSVIAPDALTLGVLAAVLGGAALAAARIVLVPAPTARRAANNRVLSHW